MKEYDPKKIEKKWQEKWRESGMNEAKEDSKKPKNYILDMFPYPSADGLHVGHVLPYTATDVYSRFRRMNGDNVLHPIGWDAFGLPAENFAIKTKVHPREKTNQSIENFRKQLKSLGISYDWSREIGTHLPEYYRWTQWFFLFLYKNGLASRKKGKVNWCESCQTVLANEQVESGRCERCKNEVVQKDLKQWFFHITKYAEELISGLDDVDWPESTKINQRNWIGKSEGAEIEFQVQDSEQSIRVFTTRPDTLFGATYVVLAPEHELLKNQVLRITNQAEVEEYINQASRKTEIERTAEGKEKTGVKLEGVSAINPANSEVIPIFIADYVLAHYGTGAIMAVPAHDERDFEFAKQFGLPMKQVVVPCADDSGNPPRLGMKEVKRDTMIVHLRDKSTGKFALLDWHGSLEGITTAIMGGIEPDQTPEEAVFAEINEEAALTDITIKKKLRWITAARYCASHKGENRCAVAHAFVAEVENLSAQETIPESEQKLHTLVWVDESEILNRLTPDHQKQVWKLFQNETSLTGEGFLMNSPENLVTDLSSTEDESVIGFGALLKTSDGKFLLQERDQNAPVSPGKIAPFGGGRKEDENILDCMKRELKEELSLEFEESQVEFIGKYASDNFPGKFIAMFVIDSVIRDELKLFEGASIKEMLPEEILQHEDTTDFTKNFLRSYKHHTVDFNGMDSEEAKRAITEYVGGEMKTTYKLRDWLVSRQRYWGAPIPIIYCEDCGEVPVPEDDLPVLLPDDVDFMPTGESPLAKSKSFHDVKCPKCGKPARRESDTMDTFVCSSWYYYRFADPKNGNEFASSEKIKKWLPVDLYVGGAEHTVLHLMYARFFTKVLADHGYANFHEPFLKLRHQGMILAEDGNKMSKSLGNVVNPDEVVDLYGADTLRLYELFMGPFETAKPWSSESIIGARRFLEKVWRLSGRVNQESSIKNQAENDVILHKTIKKITEDIEKFAFNTAISQMMICVNAMEKAEILSGESWRAFLGILAPFAPHITEELWSDLGEKESVHLSEWPEYDETQIVETRKKIAVQVNGKVRGTVSLEDTATETEAVETALALPEIARHVEKSEITQTIYRPGKILSFVMKKENV